MFTYLGSSVSSNKNRISTWLAKAWAAIYSLSVIWKSELTDRMKRNFFQAVVVSTLLYGCTTWTLTKRMEKKFDGNYTRMLRDVLNESWSQQPIKLQLYDHLPPIMKTLQVRRTRYVRYSWKRKDEHISNILLWTPSHGRAKAGRPDRTCIEQLSADTGCCLEDLRRRWMIETGGEWWSGRSVLAAWHDDDDLWDVVYLSLVCDLANSKKPWKLMKNEKNWRMCEYALIYAHFPVSSKK